MPCLKNLNRTHFCFNGRSRKKKGADDTDDSFNSSFPGGEFGEGEVGEIQKEEENLEIDPKNGIGVAGTTVAEGAVVVPIGLEGDTSTLDGIVPGEDGVGEPATPDAAKKPKKPKIKSTSSNKKRPSK